MYHTLVLPCGPSPFLLWHGKVFAFISRGPSSSFQMGHPVFLKSLWQMAPNIHKESSSLISVDSCTSMLEFTRGIHCGVGGCYNSM